MFWTLRTIRQMAVVPHAGTWIEINPSICVSLQMCVVPHAGTWIEILHDSY